MIWPPQNTGIFEYKTPCCACPVVCELGVPGGPFSTLEEAEAAMANVLECRCYFYPGNWDSLSRSFSYDSDSFTLSGSGSSATESGGDVQVILVAYLPVGTLAYSFSGILTCNSGLTISSGGSISVNGPQGEIYSATETGEMEIPEAACYTISIAYGGTCDCPPPPDECEPGCSASLGATVTMTGMVLGAAAASYGGGTLYCE